MAIQFDPWHYPRGELVEELFRWFGTGVVRRVAMFAPRRKGKTWFLIRDLAPACIRRRYIPVYASLWRVPDAPHIPVLEGINAANTLLDNRRVPWKKYLSQLQTVALNAGVISATWTPGPVDPVAASTAELAELQSALAKLVERAPEGKVVLMIDEAQHMVTHPKFSAFTHSLRTALDTLEASGATNLHTLFTGSSRTNLARLLNDPGAPFYQSVEQLELPDLDQDYTDFVVSQLKRLGGIKSIGKLNCWEAFDTVGRSPFYMELVIRSLMLRQTQNIDDAAQASLEVMAKSPALSSRWRGLRALDQVIYVSVCQSEPIYSEEALAKWTATLNRSVTKTHVQNAVRRLQKLSLVSRSARGQYQNEDPELLAWAKMQAN